jgi:glycosyltransferase involved in cell wall biosynthesis
MSNTIYFLVPYPKGEAPSQRFRFEQYLPFLQENGFEVEIHPFYDYQTWQTLYSEGNTVKKAYGVITSFLKRFGLLFKLRKADHIFIHREVAHVGPPIFEWFIAKILRRKYTYDFDDAIWLPNYSDTNAKFHRLKSYWKVNYCMKWAHKITAGNEYLASYARQYNSNVEIIPTTIDTEHHHNSVCDHEQEPLVIGWTGTHTTMRYLDELIPVLQELEQQYTLKFLVISNEAPSYNLRSLEFLKWKKETEIEDLAKINIGVMPLQHDIWSEGKCGFKGLQYMALEIASIMSPVGVNTSIVQDGVNGFLAGSPEEWKEKLILLLEDKDLRVQLGKAGKKTIEERYSVKANSEKYLKLFQAN